jgi:hypothetical protein
MNSNNVSAIQNIMDELHALITAIPGMDVRMGAMILAEVGDFSRFESPDKCEGYLLSQNHLHNIRRGATRLFSTHSLAHKHSNQPLRLLFRLAAEYKDG